MVHVVHSNLPLEASIVANYTMQMKLGYAKLRLF